MGFNKKFFSTGGIVAASPSVAAFDPLQNFETVTYTGNGGTQKITGYIRKGAAGFAYNKYITFPDLGGFTSNTSDSNGSLSIWFNLSSLPSGGGFHTLIGNGGTNVESFRILIRDAGSSQIKFEFSRGFSGVFYQDTTYSNAFTPTIGQWYHLCITYLASTKTASYYINGTSYGSNSLVNQGSYTISSGFNIGSYIPNNSSYIANSYYGKVDQFRIFDKALSSSEVTTLYNEDYDSSTKSTTDIFGDGSGVALYELDEDASDTGTTPYGTGAIDSGQSAVFNGSSSYIDTNFTVPASSTFSISWWQNLSFIGSGNDYVFSDYLTSTDDTSFGVYYTGSTIGVIGDGISASTVSTTTIGSWMHFAVVLNGTTLKIYKNGSEIQSRSITARSAAGRRILTIGKYGDFSGHSNFHITGSIDQVRIYSSALSASDVEALVSETNVPTANLVAHYKLDGNANDETTNYNGTASNITYSDPAEFPLIAYNGTPTNVNFLGMAFQPDLVWFKERNGTNSHQLYDSVRGDDFALFSNQIDGEYNYSTHPNGDLSPTFLSNGFQTPSVTNNGINRDTGTYVAWCWKAGGAAVSNTEGSITSTVSANPDAGFSIVKSTYTSTANYTVGHGLNQRPEIVFNKNLDQSDASYGQWWTWIEGITGTNGDYIRLNGTTAKAAFSDTFTTDTTIKYHTGFQVTGTNKSIVSYCFHSVDGYQKVGSYTGNGGTQTISTDFEARWIMIKRATGGTGHWYIYDTMRDGVNENALFANLSNAESSGANFITYNETSIVITASGTGVNASGSTYIYLAIA